MQTVACAFALFALAEFWSEKSGSRKWGYSAAAIFLAFAGLFLLGANLGSLIY